MSTGGGLYVRSLVIPPDEVKMRVGEGLVGISSLLLLTDLSPSSSISSLPVKGVTFSLIGWSSSRVVLGAEVLLIWVIDRDLGGAG